MNKKFYILTIFLGALLLLSTHAHANAKDPAGIEYLSIVWAFVLSMCGGLVSFIQKLNESKEPKPLFKILLKLLGELLISGFAGLMTLYICQYWHFDMKLTAILVGISGHMGGSAIKKLEEFYNIITKASK